MPRLLPLAALVAFLSPVIAGPSGMLAQGGPAAQAPSSGRGGQPASPQGGRGTVSTTGIVGGVGGPERGAPAGPAPRRPDGSIILGGTATDKGLWLPGAGGAQTLTPSLDTVPFQPWARATLAYRQRNQLEPHTRCKPSGAARQFLTPYGVEIVELPELKRIYIFDVGGPHTWRTIYMDGRPHPPNLESSPYGHSIGWWEADTLVVDSVGFDETFWMDRRGMPHTDRLHTLERFTRTDARSMRYELTVDDPGAYTETWRTGFLFGWEAGTELFEYVCQQANYADTLMLGELESVDRSSSFVP